MSLSVEELPDEIQLIIWQKAQMASSSWLTDLWQQMYNNSETNDDEFIELELMERKQMKTSKYIAYMKNMKRFELGMSKYQPEPHYVPVFRKCKVCDKYEIPKSYPTWKNKCVTCFKN